MTVHVKARPPLARRCRCGLCFDAEGQEVEVTAAELAALRADPCLIVEEVARKAKSAEQDAPTETPQDGAASPESGPDNEPVA